MKIPTLEGRDIAFSGEFVPFDVECRSGTNGAHVRRVTINVFEPVGLPPAEFAARVKRQAKRAFHLTGKRGRWSDYDADSMEFRPYGDATIISVSWRNPFRSTRKPQKYYHGW